MERDIGDKEQPTYLEPKEQLLIAAKVNRICKAEAEDFDEKLIEDAQEVIYSLASRIKPSSTLTTGIGLTTSGKNIKGETDHGEFSFSSGKRTRNFELTGRVDKYRIGNYVAQKFTAKKLDGIWFKDFFGAGSANQALRNYKPTTQITYQRGDLSLISVDRLNLKVTRLGFIIITLYDETPLWEKGEQLKSNKHSSRNS